MRRGSIFRSGFIGGGALVSGFVASAAWPLPPLDGTLRGEWLAPGAGAPVVEWRATIRSDPDAAAGRELTFAAEAPDGGLTLAASARLDAKTGDATWRIDDGRVDVSAWQPVTQELVSGWPTDLTVTGGLTLAGTGGWSSVENQPSGQLHVSGTLVEIDSAEYGVTLREARFQSTVTLADQTAEWNFSAPRGEVAGWAIKDLRLAGSVAWQTQQLHLTTASLDVAGGRVAVRPTTVDLANLKLDLEVELVGVQLIELARLLPDVLADATGAVSGNVRLTWSEADGLAIKGGRLTLAESTRAAVWLRAVPGLITSQLPPSSPGFQPLQRVELGQTALAVTVLDLVLSPPDDPLGRSARLRVEAHPVDPGLKAPFIIDVNVAGPLDDLIRLGMDERVKFAP